MFRILIIFITLTSITCFSEEINAIDLRNKFYSSVDNSQKSRFFLEELKKMSLVSSDPIVTGYLAATSMVMAKHVFNPYSKLKYFIDGKNILEKIILKSPNHVELRLIRFAIQTNVPSFLGYSKEIQSDKQFLLKTLKKNNGKTIESNLELIIRKYLVQSKVCTSEEVDQIN